jgi:hypothetical protein
MRIDGSLAAQQAIARQQLAAQQQTASSGTPSASAPQPTTPARGADTAQLAQAAKPNTPASAQNLNAAASAPPALLYGQEDVARLQQAWNTTAGSNGFTAEYDFNADGTIDGTDLGQLLGLYGQQKSTGVANTAPASAQPYGEADIVGLKAAWNLSAGDDGFRAEYDFNGDGKIDGADLGQLLGRYGQARDGAPAAATAQNGQGVVSKTDDDSVDLDPHELQGFKGDDSVDLDPHELQGFKRDDSVDITPQELAAQVVDSGSPVIQPPVSPVSPNRAATTRPADVSLAGTQDTLGTPTTPADSVLFTALLPATEPQSTIGTIDPSRDARDLSLLLDELGRIQEDSRQQQDISRADLLAEVRSSFTQLLSQPLEARDSLSLLLGRLSQGGAIG